MNVDPLQCFIVYVLLLKAGYNLEVLFQIEVWALSHVLYFLGFLVVKMEQQF